MQVQVVHEVSTASARAVYDYARQMDRLPQWASGLAQGIEQRGKRWFSQSPMGEVEIEMAPANDYGVLDHDVTLPDGSKVHNALRVSPVGDGCVLTFVVLRLPGTSNEAFKADVQHVHQDLKTLCRLLEVRR